MKRVKQGDIVVGRPLPYNCYDPTGKLLLKKDMILANERQLEVLIERGLYSDGMPDTTRASGPPVDKPSVFTQISLIEMRLDKLFQGVLENKPEPKFAETVLHFARDIQALCALDPDAALGAVHLSQKRRYTTAHPIDVAILAELIGLRKAMPDEARISMLAAALTANLSILELQEAMQRQMSPLREEQLKTMHTHPVLTVERLRELGVQDEAWFATVLNHHEKQDGSGYPAGKRGEDIPLAARIIALADTYSAMVTPRCYRPNQLAKDALREVFLKRGSEIDAELAALFIKEIGIYPPGALVKLANGETAVVLKRGLNGTSPRVKSILNPRGIPLSNMAEHDTSVSGFEIRDMVARDVELKLDLRQIWS